MGQICRRRILRLLVVFLFSGLIVGIARAQAPTPAAGNPSAASQHPGAVLESPESSDKVVLKVGDQQFTKADLDFLFANIPPQARQSLATQGKKPMGDQFAVVVMLSQQARLHHLDQTPDFVRRLAMQKQQMEAQTEYEEITEQAKVTPEDINKYYMAHSADYDEITVRQFVIRKKPADSKADPAHPSASTVPGLAPEEAKARAEAIRKEALAGTDMKKVMDDFKAPGDVIIDAEPRKIRRGGMRPELEKVAFALKDGEISEPVDLPQALVFFQVTGHGHLDVKDVSPEIERNLKQERVNAAMADVKKNTTVWMDDQYFAPPAKPAGAPSLGPPVLTTPKH